MWAYKKCKPSAKDIAGYDVLILIFTLTAMPFKSEDAEAAVGEVLATVFVLVSDM